MRAAGRKTGPRRRRSLTVGPAFPINELVAAAEGGNSEAERFSPSPDLDRGSARPTRRAVHPEPLCLPPDCGGAEVLAPRGDRRDPVYFRGRDAPPPHRGGPLDQHAWAEFAGIYFRTRLPAWSTSCESELKKLVLEDAKEGDRSRPSGQARKVRRHQFRYSGHRERRGFYRANATSNSLIIVINPNGPRKWSANTTFVVVWRTLRGRYRTSTRPPDRQVRRPLTDR